jgi:hypothetical protein
MTDEGWTAQDVLRKAFEDVELRRSGQLLEWRVDKADWPHLLTLLDGHRRPLAFDVGIPYLVGEPVRFVDGARLHLAAVDLDTQHDR